MNLLVGSGQLTAKKCLNYKVPIMPKIKKSNFMIFGVFTLESYYYEIKM